MVAQSISGGVRSLMRTLYNVGGSEKENDVESPPAKRRRIDVEDAKRDGEHQNEHSATKPQNGTAIQRRISSRTRRNRNHADHDGNEGEEVSERSIHDKEEHDKFLAAGQKKSEFIEPRCPRRSRQRNNADHSGNGNEGNPENVKRTVKGSKGYSVAGSNYSKSVTRQNSRSQSKGMNIDIDGTDEVWVEKNMAKNIELEKGRSASSTSGTGTLKRPTSRARPKRNNADHFMNEEDVSENIDKDSNSELDVRSLWNRTKGSRRQTSIDTRHEATSADSVLNEREENDKQLSEGHSSKRLSGRSRRERNQADHHGNEVGDLSLMNVQNGDNRSPITPTNRLKSWYADASNLTGPESETHRSSGKPSTIPRSRNPLSNSRGVENHRIGTNEFHDQLDSDMVQSSPLRTGRRSQQSRRKGTLSKARKSSPAQSMNEDQDSPFISDRYVGSIARKSEIFSDAEAVSSLRRILRDRLTCNRSTKLIGIDTEYQKVYRLIEQTVSAGEGNSVLLIGARGCGKSAIVCRALEEVSREHSRAFYTIKLNGFFLTDDRIALREIWRQLGQEMEVEDETSGKNYADTLSKLLALLSHSAETDNGDSAATQKSLIFIMEEFDQFTSHPRQTLLYNLLDVAQSRKTPIAVIGMTTRIDIAESMEKRVKSRFSHRYIHIPLARNYDTFRAICRANLECTSENLTPKELIQFSKNKKPIGKAKKDQKGFRGDFLEKWNSQVSVCYFLYHNYKDTSS